MTNTTKKRLAALGMTTILGVGALAGASLAESRLAFPDVQSGAWYYNAVDTVTNDLKLMSGYDTGLFGPGDSLTREQFVQILYKMSGVKSEGYGAAGSKFTDVDTTAWYAPALAWAEENNVTSGTSDTTFGTGQAVTREQMAVLMKNYCKQNDLDPVGDSIVESFADADTASSWAKTGVEWSRKAGLFVGDENHNFNPGKDLSRAEAAQVIAKFYSNAHDYEESGTTKATCTEDGRITYTCKICGKTKTEAIAALGHSYDEGKVTKEATCTEKGEKTVTCTVCGDAKSESITALGYAWDEGEVTTEASCTKAGETTYTCTRDDCDATKTEAIAALDHSWGKGKITKAATCSTSGVMTYTCTNDGCSATKTEVVPATDEHDYKVTSQKAATCTKNGSTTYTCSTCGDSYIETVKATGHNWGESTVTTAATCRRAGIKTSACTNDGCTATRTEEIAALGHSWDEGKVTKAATCTQNVVKTYTCTRDGATKTETIKAYGSHSYQVTDSKDPTCTEDGYKTYTCANCGDSYTETIETSGHNWGTTAYTLLDGSKPLITYPRFEVTTFNNNKTHPAYIESPTKMTLTEWRNSDQADELNVKRHFFVGTNEDGTFKVAYGTLEDIMGEYPSDTQFSWTETQEWNQAWTFNGEILMYYANPSLFSGNPLWVTGTEERLFYNCCNEDGTFTEEYQYIVDLARRYGWDKIGKTTENVIQITLDSTTCETCGATK